MINAPTGQPLTSWSTAFDYSALDMESRVVVWQRTTELKTLMRRSATDLIEIGQKLLEVKERIGHGGFGAWLTAEFDWSERTAQNYMNVAGAFKSATVADLLPAKALYLLAAPSTPEAARIEIIERAEQGEPITYATAKAAVQTHQPPKLPPDWGAYRETAEHCDITLEQYPFNGGIEYKLTDHGDIKTSAQWSTIRSYLDQARADRRQMQVQQRVDGRFEAALMNGMTGPARDRAVDAREAGRQMLATIERTERVRTAQATLTTPIADAYAAGREAELPAAPADPHAGWMRIKTAMQAHHWKPVTNDGWHEALCGKRTQDELWPHIHQYFCTACEAAQKQLPAETLPAPADPPLSEAELATLARGGWFPLTPMVDPLAGSIRMQRRGDSGFVEGFAPHWRNVIRGIESAEAEAQAAPQPSTEMQAARRYQLKLTASTNNLMNRKQFAAELALVQDYYDCLLTVAGLPTRFDKAVEAVLLQIADLVDDKTFDAISKRLEVTVSQ